MRFLRIFSSSGGPPENGLTDLNKSEQKKSGEGANRIPV
jgi:hypothetical protein